MRWPVLCHSQENFLHTESNIEVHNFFLLSFCFHYFIQQVCTRHLSILCAMQPFPVLGVMYFLALKSETKYLGITVQSHTCILYSLSKYLKLYETQFLHLPNVNLTSPLHTEIIHLFIHSILWNTCAMNWAKNRCSCYLYRTHSLLVEMKRIQSHTNPCIIIIGLSTNKGRHFRVMLRRFDLVRGTGKDSLRN